MIHILSHDPIEGAPHDPRDPHPAADGLHRLHLLRPAPATDQAAPTAESASSVGTSTTYQVEGMTCGHCAKSVTDQLTALNGVIDVHIGLVAGGASTVTVTATRPLSPEAVRTAVAEAGYTLVTA